MKPEYVVPALELESFNSVRCHVFARQHWYFMHSASQASGYGEQMEDDRFRVQIARIAVSRRFGTLVGS